MPYWLRFTIFLLAANVVALSIGHFFSALGIYWIFPIAVVYAYVVVLLGRWSLKGLS